MTEPTTPLTRDVHSADAMSALGAAFATCLASGAVVAISGELGAGKTQFVKGIATGLGIAADTVTSPTFTLVHVYERPERSPKGIDRAIRRLIHVDAYRLGDTRESLELGLDDELGAPGTVACIEWPERLGTIVPDDRFDIALAHVGANFVETRRAILARVTGSERARACAVAVWSRHDDAHASTSTTMRSDEHGGH